MTRGDVRAGGREPRRAGPHQRRGARRAAGAGRPLRAGRGHRCRSASTTSSTGETRAVPGQRRRHPRRAAADPAARAHLRHHHARSHAHGVGRCLRPARGRASARWQNSTARSGEVAGERGIAVIDIAPVNELVAGDPSLVSSATGPIRRAKQYAGWVEVIGPHIRRAARHDRAVVRLRPLAYPVP